jgi:uncharacterized protein YbbC (DUF1343 family)
MKKIMQATNRNNSKFAVLDRAKPDMENERALNIPPP